MTILADFKTKSAEEIAGLIFERAKNITNETFTLEKFVNQIEVISKIRNLDGFIKDFIQNNMALELKLEDTFTYKEGKKEGKRQGKKEVILELLKRKKLNVEEIAEVAKVTIEYVLELAKRTDKD